MKTITINSKSYPFKIGVRALDRINEVVGKPIEEVFTDKGSVRFEDLAKLAYCGIAAACERSGAECDLTVEVIYDAMDDDIALVGQLSELVKGDVEALAAINKSAKKPS